MNDFWKLLKESVILQFTVTLLLILTTMVIYARGDTPPQSLLDMALFALGFTFGGKVENAKQRAFPIGG
jgi:hypothetical protein